MSNTKDSMCSAAANTIVPARAFLLEYKYRELAQDLDSLESAVRHLYPSQYTIYHQAEKETYIAVLQFTNHKRASVLLKSLQSIDRPTKLIRVTNARAFKKKVNLPIISASRTLTIVA